MLWVAELLSWERWGGEHIVIVRRSGERVLGEGMECRRLRMRLGQLKRVGVRRECGGLPPAAAPHDRGARQTVGVGL